MAGERRNPRATRPTWPPIISAMRSLLVSICAQADLRAADFYRAYLQGVDFRGSDMRGASLNHADCRGCDFTDAKMDGAVFRDADLRCSTLEYVDNAAVTHSSPQIAVRTKRLPTPGEIAEDDKTLKDNAHRAQFQKRDKDRGIDR